MSVWCKCAFPSKTEAKNIRDDGKEMAVIGVSRQMERGGAVSTWVLSVAPRSIEFLILLSYSPSTSRRLTWVKFHYLIHCRSA